MTTEAGSETEVKKEPEKTEEQAAAPEQATQAPAEAPKQQELKGEPEQQSGETASPAGDGDTPQNPPADAQPKAATPEKERKQKEPSAGKGISRFLPPWLKRQKSQSQVELRGAEKDPQGKVGEQQQQPGQESNQKSPVLEGKEAPAEDVKTDDKEEKHSIGSADTQPAKEEKGEESLERSTELKDEESKSKEKEEGETPKPDLGTEKPPLKATKKMKTVMCKVTLLDGSQFPCEVEKRAKGHFLFFKVCEHLNLLEKDYFGLSYKDNADGKCWLDPAKEIKRQIRNSPWQFAFNVKFYPPDPSQLTEDLTRYLLCLQLRQDIASGRLPCSFVTHSLLGSYTLQAELGDYDPCEHPLKYLSDFHFAPTQTREMEEKVVELHKNHRGMTPAQADTQFLENAKKLSMYGVDLHHAKDSEGVDIMLGVCANGLLVYKDRLRINRFAWPKILKISYKRSNFYIKIRPGETEQFESSVGFKLQNHRSAKRLWKVCVEHHTFFRLVTPEQPPRARFLTLGSKFRYSGRTQAQTRQASSLIDRPAPYFERTSSKRVSRSLDGAPMVSVSDQGLRGDSSVVGDKVNAREPALELSSDSKSKLRVQGENIYVRHSNLMLEDLDKTQEDVLKHQASISELKRSFMESTPEPRPSQWDKRLTASPATSLRLQAQGSLEEEINSILFSKAGFSSSLADPFVSRARAAEGAVAAASFPVATGSLENLPPSTDGPLPDHKDIGKSTEDKQRSGAGEQAEVEVEETVVIKEVKKAPKTKDVSSEVVACAIVVEKTPEEMNKEDDNEGKEKKPASGEVSSSSDSHSESEEEAEYQPQASSVSVDKIKEEPEEEEPNEEALPPGTKPTASVTTPHAEEEQGTTSEVHAGDEAHNGHTEMQQTLDLVKEDEDEEEEEEPTLNGDVSRTETERLPQVICCSEPPVIKTEMVTISDTFAAQKTEISTKEVPIVHTETKTITYEAAQLDGAGDSEPGLLMTAQTITSESLCTTTTTHITKTLKGGLSETRIEKRIVITGDSDIDHDQALAQAIKEAKEQHPDMSVTRVVVHKETDLAEEGED
ncbi:band 4.1-like protein 2 [Arapaima gigas]